MAYNEDVYIAFGDVAEEIERKPEDEVMDWYNRNVDEDDDYYEEDEVIDNTDI